MPAQSTKPSKKRILGALISTSPAITKAVDMMYNQLSSIRRSYTDLGQQVDDTVESLRKASSLVDILQLGIKERMDNLQKTHQEIDRCTTILKAKEIEIEPIVETFRAAFPIPDSRREKWFHVSTHLAVGFVFCVAGVVAAGPLKKWFDEHFKHVMVAAGIVLVAWLTITMWLTRWSQNPLQK